MQKNNETYEAFKKNPNTWGPEAPLQSGLFCVRYIFSLSIYIVRLFSFFYGYTDCDLLKSQGRDNESINFPVRPLEMFCQFSACG